MEHYYTEKQNSVFRPHKIKVQLCGNEFELYSASGVFSKSRVDRGTMLLIESAIVKDRWCVLDLGCSYGAVGIAIKLAYPETNVVMSDVNARAMKLARMNAKLNNVRVELITSDIFKSPKLNSRKFNTILLNPPQTAGKDVCFRMISEAREHLLDGGSLQLVARHNKGGKTLSEKMKEVFDNVRDVDKKGGFRVYASEKN